MIEHTLLQTDVAAQFSAELLAAAFGLLAGALSPTYYATERLRGLGRAFLSRLPYESPPGQSPDEAMMEAVDAEEQPPPDETSEPTRPEDADG